MAKAKKDDVLVVPKDTHGVKGMFRVQIDEDGDIVGDSGWRTNQITNLGFNLYLVSALGGIAGSAQVKFMALGTGGYPATGDIQLLGEISGSTARSTLSAVTQAGSKSVQFTGTFASTNNFLGASSNIANIGLYNTATTGAGAIYGTMFAGQTFASSTVATNQNVNCTYLISFA